MGNLIVKYGGSFPNRHSRKWKALLMATFTKHRFSQLPIETNFVFLHSRKRLAPVTENFFVSRWSSRLRKLPLYYMQ